MRYCMMMGAKCIPVPQYLSGGVLPLAKRAFSLSKLKWSSLMITPHPTDAPILPFTLPFTKMHGLGNDFIALRSEDMPAGADLAAMATMLCDRNTASGPMA